MITKEEILEYIKGATNKKAEELCSTLTTMLTEQQLKALDKQFSKKLDFNPPKTKPQPLKPEFNINDLDFPLNDDA